MLSIKTHTQSTVLAPGGTVQREKKYKGGSDRKRGKGQVDMVPWIPEKGGWARVKQALAEYRTCEGCKESRTLEGVGRGRGREAGR